MRRRLIKDIRVYDDFAPKDKPDSPSPLLPWNALYGEMLTSLLRREGLDCKTFDHFYIMLADSLLRARWTCHHGLRWMRDAPLAFDFRAYMRGDDDTKQTMMLATITKGLLQIARREGLDVDLIRRVCKEVSKTRLETKLVLTERENRKLKAHVWYCARPRNRPIHVFLNVRDKVTGEERDILIEKLGSGIRLDIDFLFSGIIFKLDEIWVVANRSSWGEFFTKKRPRTIVVHLGDWRIKKLRKWGY